MEQHSITIPLSQPRPGVGKGRSGVALDQAILDRYLENDINNRYMLADVHVAFPGLLQFIKDNAGVYDFFSDVMSQAIHSRSMSGKQVKKCMEIRQEALAELKKPAPFMAKADKLWEVFENARTSGLEKPFLVAGDVAVKPSDSGDPNRLAVFVSHGLAGYVEKTTTGGLFMMSTDAPREWFAKIHPVLNDPERAAALFGQRTGTCGCCRRKLTDPVSVRRGIGPICAGRWFQRSASA